MTHDPTTPTLPEPEVHGWHDLAAFTLVLMTLVAWNPLRNQFDGQWRIGANLVIAAFIVTVGIFGGLDATDMGLGRNRIGRGLIYGSAAFISLFVAITSLSVIPAAAHYFNVNGTSVSAARAWFKVLIAIPIGTVVIEEIAFRGVILGVLDRRLHPAWGIAATSIIFGLWHVPDAAHLSGGGIAYVTAVGTFAATAVAGVAFALLRLRSGSLLAPAMAHIGTNSIAFAIAWLHWH
jgi:membrane protease YdiL (CAAX protease family)